MGKGGQSKGKGQGKGQGKGDQKQNKGQGKGQGGNKSRDGGAGGLAGQSTYRNCVLAEYVWLDAHNVPRSKTKTLTTRPKHVDDLPVWNFDGSSTEQAEGHNSEVLLYPRAIFDDPFRGGPHVLVMSECINAWDNKPSIGNTRAACAEVHNIYASLEPWYGIEQEYTLMRPE